MEEYYMDTYFNNNDFETGKVIIALNKQFNNVNLSSYSIEHIFNGIDIEKIEYLYRSNKIDNNSNMGDIILIYLKNKEKMAVISAISKLSNIPYVVYAEPDYLYEPDIIPNDPDFEYLWGMPNINAPLAWNYTTGTKQVVVGVLDSGIDANHPDLRGNLWFNGPFFNGWNFVNNNPHPTDVTGHGTHVAGTIGAVGNNSIGITGICWNVQLASFKIGDNRIELAAAINAIYFANMMNIPILNNSWGGRSYSPILKYAIEQYDGLFIASAGNSSSNNDLQPSFPASYNSDNIISVAASTPENTLSSFSNYGIRSVDIAAPGTDILSTDLDGEYSYKTGTSMATPHVAGAAALLKSYMPFLTTFQIKNIILLSSTKSPFLTDKLLTGGILNVDSMIKLANFLFLL